MILDEYWDFPGPWRFQDFGQLSDGLLENLRRANVNFSDDYHDWNVER